MLTALLVEKLLGVPEVKYEYEKENIVELWWVILAYSTILKGTFSFYFCKKVH